MLVIAPLPSYQKKATFDSVRVYICDFHREQAWTRWVNNSQNGLTKPEAEILLSLLRKCAWAPSKDGETDANYKEAVNLLQVSDVWKQHANVRSWLLSTWLNISEVLLCHTNFMCNMFSNHTHRVHHRSHGH